MSTVHSALASVFGALLDPLAALPPLLGLTLISAISGVLVLLVFRFTSNPVAVRIARQRAQAHLLAIRLYRDDLAVVLRAQRSLVSALAVYVGRMLIPFVVLLLPFGLLFGHLEARYGTRALHPGEHAIVKVLVVPTTVDTWRIERADAGIVVESPPVRIPARGEIAWRIGAVAPGCHALTLAGARARAEKTVCVAADDTGATPERAIAGVAGLFTAPIEPAIEASAGIAQIDVGYPEFPLRVHGRHVSWLIIFLIVSAAVALLLRRPFGVEF